jgi:hypothetical protein
MLEIVAVIALTRYLASTAEAKGQSKAWAALAPVLWLGSEFVGAFIGAVMGLDMGVYALALVCAAAGGVAAYAIVMMLPDKGLASDVVGLSGNSNNPFDAGS